MPELPEVETVVRSLRSRLLGARITGVTAAVDRLRQPLDLPALRASCRGRTITEVRRRAKYIVVCLDNGNGLVLHLGMTGAFRIVPARTPAGAHERLAWRLADGRTWRFRDVRRFGSVQVCRLGLDGCLPAELAGLGVEPLEGDFTGAFLRRVCRRRSRPIKNLIMDQAIVVGVGNIYASEALFRAGIRPQRASGRLTLEECRRLVSAIREVLSEAIAAGGTTIDDFRDVDGSEGNFEVQLNVYGRAGKACPRCGPRTAVRRIVQAGRATFYCPGCQH